MVVRSRGLPKFRNSPSDQRTVANSAPIPFRSVNIVAGVGAPASFAAASTASRSASTALDLFEKQLEPVKLAADLPLQMLWQRAAITRPELLQPLPPIAVQRLILDP